MRRRFPRPEALRPADPNRFFDAPDGRRYRVWLSPPPRHLQRQQGETRLALTFVAFDNGPARPNVVRWVPAGTVLEEMGEGELGVFWRGNADSMRKATGTSRAKSRLVAFFCPHCKWIWLEMGRRRKKCCPKCQHATRAYEGEGLDEAAAALIEGEYDGSAHSRQVLTAGLAQAFEKLEQRQDDRLVALQNMREQCRCDEPDSGAVQREYQRIREARVRLMASLRSTGDRRRCNECKRRFGTYLELFEHQLEMHRRPVVAPEVMAAAARRARKQLAPEPKPARSLEEAVKRRRRTLNLDAEGN